jgi:hypothetical protein
MYGERRSRTSTHSPIKVPFSRLNYLSSLMIGFRRRIKLSLCAVGNFLPLLVNELQRLGLGGVGSRISNSMADRDVSLSPFFVVYSCLVVLGSRLFFLGGVTDCD